MVLSGDFCRIGLGIRRDWVRNVYFLIEVLGIFIYLYYVYKLILIFKLRNILVEIFLRFKNYFFRKEEELEFFVV